MRYTTLLSGIICLLCLLAACGDSHFMTDASYRSRVERDFQQKKALMPQGDLFAIFETSLSDYEREALEFLYAYMPLADIADYSGEFHLMNVRASRQAADEMPWGKRIPEDIFRHFVLPVRVNNEHLDSARVVFYKELKDRVKTLSLQDAILEVNHWCHEKAIYTPSDARTSSPLATVRTAYGRCGEESTFLVAALRSVGIPARQVYTPRWAHTDDNHAWVEAWADGKWYFLGACEPEPVLNLGWFNAPASRGMIRGLGGRRILSRRPHSALHINGVLGIQGQHPVLGHAQGDVSGQGTQAGREFFGAVPVFTLRISCERDHLNRRCGGGVGPLAIECERRTVKGQRHLSLRADTQNRGERALQIQNIRQHGKAVPDGREQLIGIDIAAFHEPRAEQKILFEKYNALAGGAHVELNVVVCDTGQLCQR